MWTFEGQEHLEVHIAEGNIPSTNLLKFTGMGRRRHLTARHWRTEKNFAVVKISFHDAWEIRVATWLEKTLPRNGNVHAPSMMMFSSGSSKVLKVDTEYSHSGGATTLISS